MKCILYANLKQFQKMQNMEICKNFDNKYDGLLSLKNKIVVGDLKDLAEVKLKVKQVRFTTKENLRIQGSLYDTKSFF